MEETEPCEHVLSNHNDPVADPAKVNLVPRAHVSFGQCLGAEQKTRGLWEGDYTKASECVWKTHLSHFYVLHTTMKFEISVFP